MQSTKKLASKMPLAPCSLTLASIVGLVLFSASLLPSAVGAQSPRQVCPVNLVYTQPQKGETDCEECSFWANEIEKQNAEVRRVEQLLDQAIGRYNELCGKTFECDEEAEIDPNCIDGEKVSFLTAYTGNAGGGTWPWERMLAFDATFDSFDDLLAQIDGRLRRPIDPKGVCRDCLGYLKIFQHASEQIAGTYQFGDYRIESFLVDSSTGKFKESSVPAVQKSYEKALSGLTQLKPYLCESAEIVFTQCEIGIGDKGELTGKAIANFLGATVLSPDFSAKAGGCPTADSPTYWADPQEYKVFRPSEVSESGPTPCEIEKANHERQVRMLWNEIVGLKVDHEYKHGVLLALVNRLDECEKEKCRPTTGGAPSGDSAAVNSGSTTPLDGASFGFIVATEVPEWCDFGLTQATPIIETIPSEAHQWFYERFFGGVPQDAPGSEGTVTSPGTTAPSESVGGRPPMTIERMQYLERLFYLVNGRDPTGAELSKIISQNGLTPPPPPPEEPGERATSESLEEGDVELHTPTFSIDGPDLPGAVGATDGGPERDPPATNANETGVEEQVNSGSDAVSDGESEPTSPELPNEESQPSQARVQVFVKAKKTVLESDGTTTQQPAQGVMVKMLIVPPDVPTTVADVKPETDVGYDQDPIVAETDEDGDAAFWVNPIEHLFDSATSGPIDAPQNGLYDAVGISGEGENLDSFYWDLDIDVDLNADAMESYNIEGQQGQTVEALLSELPEALVPYVVQALSIDGIPFVTTMFTEVVAELLSPLIDQLEERDDIIVEINFCWTKQAPNDPSFVQKAAAGRSGSWGQPYDDQWAIKRVGLTAANDSAWNDLGENPKPVTVAVIDTGLDWNHLDFSWDNIWRNGKEIPNNGKDDDGNGYVDDVIGWDFMAKGNKPWDYDGHGTIVAGIIAATQNNEVGIAGINPHAEVMVLKSLNAFGNTRASFVAEAIKYAADNGARLINVSVGGPGMSRMAQAAIDYANEQGSMIVAAAGNEGQSLENYGPAGMPGVFTVSATDLDDARTVFSNWGGQVDIAAPGVEVLSLRARRTDTMLGIPDVEYVNAANYVGEDKRYYRVSGTSFAAPIVTGVASLVLSKEPDVSNEELRRILTQSAEDTEIPGKDQYTGYGIVDAKAALKIDRDFFIESIISGASVVQVDGQAALQVTGTADANRFKRAWVEIGAGENPSEWKRVAREIKKSVTEQALAIIPAQEFAGATVWMLKLVTEDKDGKQRQAWFKLTLG